MKGLQTLEPQFRYQLERHPQLQDLVILALDPRVSLVDWLHHYHSHPVAGVHRYKLLHLVLFGDASREVACVLPPETVLSNVLDYFYSHPDQPFDPWQGQLKKETILKPICKLFNLQSQSALPVVQQLIFKPLLDTRCGKVPHTALPPELLHKLETIEARFYLTTDDAAQMLSMQGETSFRLGPHYFDLPSQTVFIRNALVFTNALLVSDRQGGRIQNAIPVALTKRLGITRLSVPQLLMAVDVIALALLDIIDLDKLSTKGDFMKLKSIESRSLKYPGELRDLAQTHLQHRIMHRTHSINFSLMAGRGLGGQYDSGFIFNCHRLLTKKQFAPFAHYYAAISDARLLDRYSQLHQQDAQWSQQLRQYQRLLPDEFTGIRMRDLMNALSYLHYIDVDLAEAGQHLPYVAQWAFGLPEFEGSVTKQKSRTRKPVSAKSRSTVHTLPLIEEIRSIKSGQGYLLYPGFLGSLPTTGRIYFPACLAKIYQGLPAQVELIGSDMLNWGEDVYEQAVIKDLIDQGVDLLQ